MEDGWAKSTKFAEIYDGAGLVKKQDGFFAKWF